MIGSLGILGLIQAANELVLICPEDLLYGSHLYRLFLPYDGAPRGLLHPETVKLIPWTDKFVVDHDTRRIEALDSSDGHDTTTAVNDAFAEIVEGCIQSGKFAILHGRKQDEWRALIGAPYPVQIYRHAQSLFGFVGQGVHLTAYVNTSQGLKVWVPRRSATLDLAPNQLDNTAAGCLPAHLGPLEAMMAEADEEASLPEALVRRHAVPAGAITYASHLNAGNFIVQDIVYVYDIQLDQDTIPRPHDDEVQQFHLMGLEEVMARLLNRKFKTNSTLVMIDFLIRHGIITPENEENYVDIITLLHRRLPLSTSRCLSADQ